MSKRSLLTAIAVLALLSLIGIVACSDDTPSPFSTTTPEPAGDASEPADSGGSGVSEPAGPDVANGETKFTGLGCSGCHQTSSDKLVGPGLAGVGSKGDDFIRQSIIDPAAVLAEGYANLMPTTFADMKESDLEDLVGYLKTLK